VIGLIITLFYSLIGLVVLYLIILYAVSNGIDSSKEVKELKLQLTEMKKQLEDLIERK
jgi:ABC-type lipoprotein release transport system permease subunit